MSIQQDKYKALRSKNKTTLTNLAKKYGYNVPKNINNIESFGKRLSNFIEKIQFKDYEIGIPKVKTAIDLIEALMKEAGITWEDLAREIEGELKDDLGTGINADS